MEKQMNITQKSTPNQSSRNGYKPCLIVWHIADGTYNGTVAWEMNRDSQVSSHFVLGQGGEITQLVPLIKSKLTNSQWESICNYAVAGVQAAEIIINAQGRGADKFEMAKDYIEQQCAAHGIKIDADTVQIAIENAWKALGLDQKQTVSEAE